MIRLLAAMALLAPAAFAAEDSWVLVRGERGATMHGDLADLRVARRHLKDSGPAYLWFRHDGREYVVRDGKAIEQIDEFVRPQEELGAEQGRLGKHQARLGQQQAELGMRQARAALRGDHGEERELGKAQESSAGSNRRSATSRRRWASGRKSWPGKWSRRSRCSSTAR